MMIYILFQDIVKEMNRLGMLIDVSHASMNTVRDVMRTSLAPIIFSHSATRKMCNIARNLPDDVLNQLVRIFLRFISYKKSLYIKRKRYRLSTLIVV